MALQAEAFDTVNYNQIIFCLSSVGIKGIARMVSIILSTECSLSLKKNINH